MSRNNSDRNFFIKDELISNIFILNMVSEFIDRGIKSKKIIRNRKIICQVLNNG